MRHVVIDGVRSVDVVSVPDPVPPGPDGVVIEVDATAICGSDLHFYDGDIPFGDAVAPGHEFLGTVVEAGPEVSRFRVGDPSALREEFLLLAEEVRNKNHGWRNVDPFRAPETGPR